MSRLWGVVHVPESSPSLAATCLQASRTRSGSRGSGLFLASRDHRAHLPHVSPLDLPRGRLCPCLFCSPRPSQVPAEPEAGQPLPSALGFVMTYMFPHLEVCFHKGGLRVAGTGCSFITGARCFSVKQGTL